MKRRLINLLVHPFALSIYNLLLLVLVYSSLNATWFHLQPANHFEEAVELWEGFGTILLGFGVVLEERSSLRHMAGFEQTNHQMEDVSHDYGVIFVIFGVIIELFAWLVKIPNEALDTYGVEFFFLNISAVTALLSACFQIKFQIDMVKAFRKPALKN